MSPSVVRQKCQRAGSSPAAKMVVEVSGDKATTTLGDHSGQEGING